MGRGKKLSKVEVEDDYEAVPGVLYIGHIPFGFFEDAMRGYFSQFGTVNRIRVSRNPKTGKSRGYAFVEFADTNVAQIAAETMDNYLMFEKVLKCHVVNPEDVHPKMFKHCNRPIKVLDWKKMDDENRKRPKSIFKIRKSLKRRMKKDKAKMLAAKELGIEFNAPERESLHRRSKITFDEDGKPSTASLKTLPVAKRANLTAVFSAPPAAKKEQTAAAPAVVKKRPAKTTRIVTKKKRRV
eukprot:TRINITY_DN3387_c0_g1_i1.p1 TRINITY_DN3387_c0_g1~~TRINITY_DN3387_c0_g1_i1.p1  ORF type:complete len:240 (+),score=72.60 TRINITY_DN3387_c0_g1_i1:129-848(+)